jgi:hypothetical protein
LKKEESKRKQLAALGIEYEFSGYAQKEVAASTAGKVVPPAKETPVKSGKGGKKEKASSAKKPAKSEEVSRSCSWRMFRIWLS